MAAFSYKVGLQNVGSFQVAGKPWTTGSVDCRTGDTGVAQIDFPQVTSWVVISNLDSADTNLRIGFSNAGVLGSAAAGNRYLEINSTNNSGPIRLDLKVTQLFLSGSDNCSVVAGLTGIDVNTIDFQTNNSPDGQNWSGSSGVG